MELNDLLISMLIVIFFIFLIGGIWVIIYYYTTAKDGYLFWKNKQKELNKQCINLNHDIEDLSEQKKQLTLELSEINGEFQELTNKVFQEKLYYKELKQSANDLDLKNQEVKKFIDQSEQLAADRAKAFYEKEKYRIEQEFEEAEQKYKQQEAQAMNTIHNLDFEISNLKYELNSLKQTQIATIKAMQQEKNIADNKNDYCLILPPEYKRDVEILLDVSNKIAKPRSVLMAIWTAYYQPIAKEKFPKILGANSAIGIYKITNQKTGECYIGQSFDIRQRWYDHCKCGLGISTPANNRLYIAMQEDGLENFSFELLEECGMDKLNEKEKYYIELYQSNIVGYNQTKGNN